MSAPLQAFESENFTAEPGHQFFDSQSVERLISDYQRTGSVQTLGEIVERSQPIFVSLIRSRHTFQYQDENELLSIVNRKLLVSLPQYDPHRGTAFAFISRVTINMLATSVTLTRKLANRYEPLTEPLINGTADARADLNSTLAVADLARQIRSIKSAVTVPSERDAQKWYVESFLDAGFEMRRHQCADAAMKVFGLTHRRSRQLYDLTILEIRRLLYAETKHSQPTRAQLARTKDAGLLRYTNFLTPEEFTKFRALMHGLPPLCVLLVKPCNEAKIGRGDWPAVRENLELVLNGIPEAPPLFRHD